MNEAASQAMDEAAPRVMNETAPRVMNETAPRTTDEIRHAVDALREIISGIIGRVAYEEIGKVAVARKEEEISRFIEENKLPFKQRDKNWMRHYRTSTGGSDMYTLSQKNGVMQVVKKKTNGGDFFSVPCIWGTMFEPLGERFIELDCNTRVLGTDVCFRGPCLGSHYSPDGYCVVRVKENGGETEVTTEDEPGVAFRIALVEIKFPFTRSPSGKVPSQYIPQIQMGLNVSKIADFSMFVDFRVRLSALKHLRFNNKRYNYVFNRDRADHGFPYSLGVSRLFAQRDKGGFLEAFVEKLLSAKKGIVDVGALSGYELTEIFRLVKEEKIFVEHHDPIFEGGRVSAEYLRLGDQNGKKGTKLMGLMGWKIFTVDYVFDTEDEAFIEALKPKIDEVREILTRVRDLEDQEGAEKAREFVAGLRKNREEEPCFSDEDNGDLVEALFDAFR